MAQALVAEPWALLNYGEPLEGACAEAARQVLATGPHGTASSPRDLMNKAGCKQEAAFNRDPSTERAIDAGLLFVGVLPAALFMILVSFSLLIAQFRLAVAFVIAPGALLLGAVQSTRHLTGRWALFAVKALLGMIAPVIVLSAMALIDLLILTGIDFNVTVGGVRIDLVAKLVLINAANLALWMKRRVVADGVYKATTVKADRALVRAGIPTNAPEGNKALEARLKGTTVMPGMRAPVQAAANRTRAAVGGARSGTAKAATVAATAVAGPAARGSAAAAAVLGVAQRTAVAAGGSGTTDGSGRRTLTASGGGARPSATPTGAGTTTPTIGVGTPVGVLPSASFATAASRGGAIDGAGRPGVALGGGAAGPAGSSVLTPVGVNGNGSGNGRQRVRRPERLRDPRPAGPPARARRRPGHRGLGRGRRHHRPYRGAGCPVEPQRRRALLGPARP